MCNYIKQGNYIYWSCDNIRSIRLFHKIWTTSYIYLIKDFTFPKAKKTLKGGKT